MRDTLDRARQRIVPPTLNVVAALAIVNGTTKTSDTSGISRNYAIVIIMLGLLAIAAAAIALFNREVSQRIPARWLGPILVVVAVLVAVAILISQVVLALAALLAFFVFYLFAFFRRVGPSVARTMDAHEEAKAERTDPRRRLEVQEEAAAPHDEAERSAALDAALDHAEADRHSADPGDVVSSQDMPPEE